MGLSLCAQQLQTYRRNSLATVLVYHPEDEFGPEIYKAFDSLPIPDKYDDHTISGYRFIDNSTVSGVQKKETGYYKANYLHALSEKELRANAMYTEALLNNSKMAKQMLAKWFGFEGTSVADATFNTQLLQTRGQYNATDVDVNLAL